MKQDEIKKLLDTIIFKAEKRPPAICFSEYREDSGWWAVLKSNKSKRPIIEERFLGADVVEALHTLKDNGFPMHENLIEITQRLIDRGTVKNANR
jgi:hypothetical protein